jgi:mono/diheme cytochrome c family protein
MKGPLATQTLRGLAMSDADPFDQTNGTPLPAAAIVTKFHWRGDKPSIQSFNSTFPNLMGGALQTAAAMDRLNDYLRSIVHTPNPNLNLDRSLRADHPAGNAVAGKNVFLDHGNSHCIVCHGLPAGTNQNVDDAELSEKPQPMKNPALRTVYQRAGIFNPTPGAVSLSGFGLGSDGSGHELPIVHPYFLSTINQEPVNFVAMNNLKAFILSFDTGTAPSACHEITLTPSNKHDGALLAQLDSLETRAASGDNGLVAWGRVAGMSRRFRWDSASSVYLTHDPAATLTRQALLDLIAAGDALTFAGVLQEETAWRSTDRNANGTADAVEPVPSVSIVREGSSLFLRWPVVEWYPEMSPDLSHPWLPAPGDPFVEEGAWNLRLPTESKSAQFYRLRRNR